MTLNRTTIRRLDAVRGLTAVYVVLCHSVGGTSPFMFGPQAVMVFFLLSGFVIHANEHVRARWNPLGYLGRRVRRIYPVLLAAMVFSVFVAWSDGTLSARFHTSELLGTLTMQQSLLIRLPFMNNGPLWSLAYEAVFYALYPLILLVETRWRLPAVIAFTILSLMVYRSHTNIAVGLVLAYLPIWWAGAEMARLMRDGLPWRRYLVIAVALSTVCLFDPNYGVMVDTVLAATLVLAVALTPEWARRVFDRSFGWAALIAPFSYGLYVLHYPLVKQWKPSASPAVRLLVCVPLAFLAAWVVESALRRGGWISYGVATLSRRRGASRPQLAPVPAVAEAAGEVRYIPELEQAQWPTAAGRGCGKPQQEQLGTL